MEIQDDDTALLKVAEAVSDGRPVDWESAQSQHDDAGAELSHLQALEVVADAHRKARLHPEIGRAGAASSLENGARDEDLPSRADPRMKSPGENPTGRARFGKVRAWVILAFVLVLLYLIFRLLGKA